ncbi:MAG: hypothetical protein U9N86_11190 [Bacteroidota bacterium]|nr:hypothetical protein [Bacteroidota bacterium]
MKTLKTLLLLIAVALLFLPACEKYNDGDGYNDTPKDDLFVFDVDWVQGTVYFDEDALSDLEKVDTADFRYYFDESNVEASALTAGDVLVIHGLALRKVTSISNNGDQIVVETEYASLNEAISDGTVSWDYGVNFTSDLQPEMSIDGQIHQFKRSTGDSFTLSTKIGSFDYKITMVFKGNKAEVTQEIEKSVGDDVKVKFACEGVIEQFRTSNKIVYKNSELAEYEYDNKGLKGELTVSLTAAGSGQDKISFEFPTTLISFPFMVGPIPVKVNVKVFFVAEAFVPPEGSAQVSAKFTYNSGTGVKYSLGGDVQANGDEGSYSIKKKKAQTGAASAIGINFGLGFPRLEVGIFGSLLVPWVHTAFLVGGDFTFTPACQQAKAAYIGACGYDFGILGYEKKGIKNLWYIEEILLQSGDCDGGEPLGFGESSGLLLN